jgi:hypothetical protein
VSLCWLVDVLFGIASGVASGEMDDGSVGRWMGELVVEVYAVAGRVNVSLVLEAMAAMEVVVLGLEACWILDGVGPPVEAGRAAWSGVRGWMELDLFLRACALSCEVWLWLWT